MQTKIQCEINQTLFLESTSYAFDHLFISILIKHKFFSRYCSK